MDVTIPVGDLVEGMYISDLDRPWTDTPFMLQGFHYQQAVHAQVLKDFCAYVYVNIERSADPGAKVLARRFGPKPIVPPTRWERVVRWLRRELGLDRKRHRSTFALAGFTTSARAQDSVALAGSFGPEPYQSGSDRFQRWLKAVLRTDRENCEAVYARTGYVTSRQGAPAARPAPAAPAAPSLLVRLLGLFMPGDSQDDERRALDAEAIVVQRDAEVVIHDRLHPARASIDRSRHAFSQVIDDIRRDRKLQMSTVQEVVDGLVDVAAEHPHALVWLNKLKGYAASSYEHAIDVSIYMVCLGRHLGYPREQLQILGLAGLLQDIGYIDLPDGLLSTPGTLTREQYLQVQSHVQGALEMLRDTPGIPKQVLAIIAQHHERWDGTGYPSRLGKEDIDPMAQIAGLADTFHAMTSDRPYRKALSTNETLQNLYKWKSGCFNEGLVDQFIQCIGIYSVGTVVELSSGEIGIVIAQNRIRRLKPRVMVTLDPQRRPYPSPRILELINDPEDASGQPYGIRRDLPPGAFGIRAEEYFL
ncbi:MAG: HD-GYP domain-containing protein [Gammaproteobacteria bacterium]